MHWILAGFLMFACSVAQYLLVRKSVLLKIPAPFVNLAMFLIPVVMFTVAAVSLRTDLTVSLYELAIIAAMAFFFSYLGNIFSLRSIEVAPNPGYSLVLSKSYVVFTTLVAIPLFNQQLTFRAGTAIAMIIIASALITVTGKAKPASHVHPSWLPLAIGAFFCWGMLSVASKYLLMIGVGVIPRLIYTMSIVTLLIALELHVKKIPWRTLSKTAWGVLLGIGVLSGGFNYFMQEGFVTAPNIGYINAMNASSIGLVVVGSAIFFRDEFSLRKFIGVVGVIIGLILLVI
jgi:drug/metabolite transporter (DMT)-like permease